MKVGERLAVLSVLFKSAGTMLGGHGGPVQVGWGGRLVVLPLLHKSGGGPLGRHY